MAVFVLPASFHCCRPRFEILNCYHVREFHHIALRHIKLILNSGLPFICDIILVNSICSRCVLEDIMLVASMVVRKVRLAVNGIGLVSFRWIWMFGCPPVMVTRQRKMF